jgi:hypothetical protein
VKVVRTEESFDSTEINETSILADKAFLEITFWKVPGKKFGNFWTVIRMMLCFLFNFAKKWRI